MSRPTTEKRVFVNVFIDLNVARRGSCRIWRKRDPKSTWRSHESEPSQAQWQGRDQDQDG